jgi:pimeloyl-ACP methyl ester carboxylesterase
MVSTISPSKPLSPPPLLNTMLEWRSGFEYLGGIFGGPARSFFPRGDGHPVLVVPGFMGSGASTQQLRQLLRQLGYRAYDWRLGRNVGPVGHMEEALLARLMYIHERCGRKPSVIGWSLGGVYARILAHSHPEHIRALITLGSPLLHPHQSAADTVYRYVTGEVEHPEHLRGIDAPPAIPATSIYSYLDGIVNWRACLSVKSAISENIRVYGSHCGLGFNLKVHWIIADRLAQAEGAWERFSWSGLLNL